MKFNQTKFLTSISLALDFVEMDLLKECTHHNKRVAYIADRIAGELGLNDCDRLDLATCSLLHDSGVSAYQFKVKRESMEGPREHCIHSQEILDIFPMRKKVDNVLLYHHEYADGSGYFGKKDIPMFSQIISIANDIEMMFNEGIKQNEISEYITSNRNIKFNSDIADIFLKLSDIPAFWLDMSPLFISSILESRLPKDEQERSWSEIRTITKVLSGIIDMKSEFTARHSSGLSEKAGIMSDYYKFDEDKKYKLLISADLHDLGKLAVPNSILDKPGKLTREEFEIIKTHTYFTRKALENLTGFEEITNWASNHHEVLTGKGYPFGVTELSFEERLLAILDIYQALTEDRPYRSGLTHNQTIEIINKMVEQGRLDAGICQDVSKALK